MYPTEMKFTRIPVADQVPRHSSSVLRFINRPGSDKTERNLWSRAGPRDGFEPSSNSGGDSDDMLALVGSSIVSEQSVAIRLRARGS